MRKKVLLSFVMTGLFVFAPLAALALSGTNADDVKVKIETKQGGEWIRVSTKDTDDKGVLKFKNAIPGWYRMEIDDDDVEAGQDLALEVRMRDNDGKPLREETDVDVFMKVAGSKVAIGTVETDEDGWLKMAGATSETEYKFEIDEDDKGKVKKKDGCYRIKVKAKMQGSGWFTPYYDRTDEAKVMKIKNVLSGKYKFKYKSSDNIPLDAPFTMRLKMVDEKGKKLKEVTDVDLYAYVNKVKVPVGTIQTDEDGWITVPGVLTHMKYKMSVKD